jgi:hypothetical protein
MARTCFALGSTDLTVILIAQTPYRSATSQAAPTLPVASAAQTCRADPRSWRLLGLGFKAGDLAALVLDPSHHAACFR